VCRVDAVEGALDKNRLVRALGLALTIGILAGCMSSARPQQAASNPDAPARAACCTRVIAAALGEPPTFNSGINAAQIPAPGAEIVEELANSALAITDYRGNLIPQLAETLPSLENGLWKLASDGSMETTWRIRKDAKWHDGAPFTSEDIMFSAQLAQDRELPGFRDSAFEKVQSIQTPDLHTVTVTWKQALIEADLLFTRNLLPKHILEQPYTEDKATFSQLPFWNRDFIGTGPFKPREWVSGSHILFEANGDYVLGRPKIDEIELRFISDPTTIIANLLAGTADVTFGRGFSVEQTVLVRDQWGDGGRVDLGFVNAWLTILPQFVNTNPPVILDVRMRRALLQAIDRQELADSIQHGVLPVAHMYLGPNQPKYRDIEARIPKYDYDPREAGRAIESLGYTRGTDGIFRDAANERLAVELRSVPTDVSSKTTFAVADFWQRAGVGVETVMVPTQRFADQEYLATYPSFVVYRQPIDVQRVKLLQSVYAPLPENNFRAVGNYNRYMNPEFDGLIDRFLSTIPTEQRMQVLGQLIYHMADQLPHMGLFYDGQPTLINNRLQNATGKTPISSQAWNVHEWTIRS